MTSLCDPSIKSCAILLPGTTLTLFAMVEESLERCTLDVSELPETRHAFYNDLVFPQEAYRPADDIEITLNDVVRGTLEEVLPRLSQQKIELPHYSHTSPHHF